MIDEIALRALLDDLARFGREHDARETDHARRLLNCGPETGQLLWILVRATRARRILEIGTSNGYSTLWLAWAAGGTGGRVITIDRARAKVAMARQNLQRAGLLDRVTILEGTALEILRGLDGPFEFVFLDADRPSYPAYIDLVLPRLTLGGLLATDNVLSHAHELDGYLDRLARDPEVVSVTLPVGNGVLLTYKRYAQGEMPPHLQRTGGGQG